MIAIIAVLIAILLPALSAARRSAQTVKCLSSLRQLGTAFQQYAQDNKRSFPVVMWWPATTANPGHPEWGAGISAAETPNVTNRTWIDMLAKYVIKIPTNGNTAVYGKYQQGSVFWGCPAFNTELWVATPNDGSDLRIFTQSYAMSPWALGPYVNTQFNLQNGHPEATPLYSGGGLAGSGAVAVGNTATIYAAGTTPAGLTSNAAKGKFYKMEQWGRHSQEKGLLADSNSYEILVSQTWTKSDEDNPATTIGTQPKVMGLDFPMTAPSFASWITVDATRHLAPTADKKKAIKSRGVNMLFVDGHASTVSPREAWIATFGGGTDTTK